jgi:hypothetical protein
LLGTACVPAVIVFDVLREADPLGDLAPNRPFWALRALFTVAVGATVLQLAQDVRKGRIGRAALTVREQAWVIATASTSLSAALGMMAFSLPRGPLLITGLFAGVFGGVVAGVVAAVLALGVDPARRRRVIVRATTVLTGSTAFGIVLLPTQWDVAPRWVIALGGFVSVLSGVFSAVNDVVGHLEEQPHSALAPPSSGP